MDFLLGPQNIVNTTCLIHLANKFIINNDIKPNNGYILMFTPPHTPIPTEKTNTQSKKGYNFSQYFTIYSPQYKANIDLIKCYTLNNFEKSIYLINNFIQISKENKGLKLILIDDLANIINLWVNIIINSQKNKAKPEEKKSVEKGSNILFIYQQVFKFFLSQISSLQRCYQIQCFISINLDKNDNIYFSKNSPRIFNAIFPYIRNCFLLQKSNIENQIDFEEIKLYFNMKTNKIEISNPSQKEPICDTKDKLLKEFLNEQGKNFGNIKNKELNNEWIKNSIGMFVENFNEFKRKQIEYLKKIKEEEEEEENDSSFTQIEK